MSDVIVKLMDAFNKTMALASTNPIQLKRQLLYVLLPLFSCNTISKFASVFGYKKDRLYRCFGTESVEDWLRFFRFYSYSRLFSIITSYTDSYSAMKSRFRITIGCDDSGFEKSGKKMPFVGLMWDHVTKKIHPGTQALYFFIIVGDKKLQFPLDLRLCRGRGGKGRPGRPTKKKTALVLDMLNDLAKAARLAGISLDRVVFTADSWFLNKNTLNLCRQMGISAVIKGKTNLVFYIDGEKVTGSTLINAQDHKWRTYEGPAGYVYARYEAVSPSLGKVVLTLWKEDDGRISFIIGTNFEHTSPKMIADYKLRWSIEVFFRDAKQQLALSEFHFTDKGKIMGHFVMRSIGFHLVDWVRYSKFRGRRTIGECCLWVRKQLEPLIKTWDKLELEVILNVFA